MLAVGTSSAVRHFRGPSPPKRVSGIPTGTPMSLKGRDQMDTPVVPLLRRQRRASSAPRPHQGNFMRMLAMPKAAVSWSLTSLREKLIKVGAKVVSHGSYHVPNGRGRGVMANVRGYPVAHRPAASAARAGVRG